MRNYSTSSHALLPDSDILRPSTRLSAIKRIEYERLFDGFVDSSDSRYLAGTRARHVLTNLTKLSAASLATIWEYADEDQDGRLSRSEFANAMYFAELVKSGFILPPKHRAQSSRPNFNGSLQDIQPTQTPSIIDGDNRKRIEKFAYLIFGFDGSNKPLASGSASVTELNERVSAFQKEISSLESRMKAIDYEIGVNHGFSVWLTREPMAN
ncbi:hypothetical protein ACOME3_009786 [Neoechinorhynchus agilis]